MMLNEIIAISNSNGTLSGTNRPKALKEGSYAGLCPFTDDPEQLQKDFLSILSLFGFGTVQITPEESNNANPKLAEEQFPDEGKTDIVLAGKQKGKQGKDGCAVKHLTTVYPDTLGLVMGLLSIPDPQQFDLSMVPAFYAPGSENEEKNASGLIAGELFPKTTATKGLPGVHNLLTGNFSVTPVPEVSGRVPVSPKERSAKYPEQRPEPSSAPAPVSSEAGQAQAVDVQVPQKLQGWLQSDAVKVPELKLVLKADLPGMGRVQAVPVEKSAKNPEQWPKPSSIPKPVSAEAEHAEPVDAKVSRVFQGRLQPDVEAVSGLEMVPKVDLPSTGQIQAVLVEGLAKEPEQGPEPSSVPEPVSAEAEHAEPVDAKVSRVFQGRLQPDVEAVSGLEMVPKVDLPSTGRVQAVPVEGMPKLHRQQQHDSLSIPDMVNINMVAEKNNPGVKGDQTKKFSSDKSMDAAFRENAPIDQKNNAGVRQQAVKGKSASFLSSKDSVETGAITVASSGASNAEDNETPNVFMAANQSGKIAGGEDASFKLPEPASGELSVNFFREAQMEKSTWVNPSPNESRPEGPSFHAEVLKQIVENTSTNLKSGQSEIRIDLKPESLGHLRLLVSSDHQQVTVKILAENTQVKEMIENQASLIKNELQQQGIHVNTVKVDMLMSGGSDFAYPQHEGTAFKQARHEPAYGGGRDNVGGSATNEPDSLDETSTRGVSLVNYFA
jgi:flagellar hook-length control protein FliK